MNITKFPMGLNLTFVQFLKEKYRIVTVATFQCSARIYLYTAWSIQRYLLTSYFILALIYFMRYKILPISLYHTFKDQIDFCVLHMYSGIMQIYQLQNMTGYVSQEKHIRGYINENKKKMPRLEVAGRCRESYVCTETEKLVYRF